jgi:hypothetical protein
MKRYLALATLAAMYVVGRSASQESTLVKRTVGPGGETFTACKVTNLHLSATGSFLTEPQCGDAPWIELSSQRTPLGPAYSARIRDAALSQNVIRPSCKGSREADEQIANAIIADYRRLDQLFATTLDRYVIVKASLMDDLLKNYSQWCRPA